VENGIGATLHKARNRRKVELSEVEAAIKIRVRYLRAIENEEWDALPGDAYARGFIRTYAYYLGLDGERLADDYRRTIAPAGEERAPQRLEPVPAALRREGSRVSSRLLIAGVCLALGAVVVAIALASDEGGGGGPSAPATPEAVGRGGQQGGGEDVVAKPGVTMRLVASAEVWTCLLDADGKPLVDGEILAAGSEAGPFRSDGFELALGNGSVEMLVNGKPAEIEESSSPVGYRIDAKGELIALEEGERPDCE
jgi:Helix-turn-helix domain/RodZ C-terminal domain